MPARWWPSSILVEALVSERQRRIGENESLFRALNEQIRDLTRTLRSETETIRVVCECGTRRCTEQLPIRVHAYVRVRRDPTLFLVKPGHDFPETEVVVEKQDGYWIVRKDPGLPEKIAREANVPRSSKA